MTFKVEDLINFIAKVLYIIVRDEISIDKAFQRIKSKWKKLDSFKVYYDIAFDIVRNYHKLEYLARNIFGTSTYKDIVRMWLLLEGHKYFRKTDVINKYIKRLCRRRKVKYEDIVTLSNVMIEELKERDIVQYLSIKYSYPIEFVRQLVDLLPMNDVEDILKSMNNPHTWLRINTLKIDVDKCIKLLESQGLEVELDEEIPFIVKVISAKRPIHHVEAVKNFLAIPQDRASVITVLVLNPEVNDVILDACAAPGMKTSLIMQLTENKTHIVAVDISKNRVMNMKYLLKKCGVDIDKVDILIADSKFLKVRLDRVNKVLIDAPCSSTGAIGKDPAIKIAISGLKRLKWYTDIQFNILRNILENVRDVEIAYATCSLLPQEGEEIIEKIIRENIDIELVDPNPRLNVELSFGYVKYGIWNRVRRTFPHKEKCEGFFISKILRF